MTNTGSQLYCVFTDTDLLIYLFLQSHKKIYLYVVQTELSINPTNIYRVLPVLQDVGYCKDIDIRSVLPVSVLEKRKTVSTEHNKLRIFYVSQHI